jgi:GT2 family glycosyltransferase
VQQAAGDSPAAEGPRDRPAIDVVVPTWRRAADLARCLDGLLRQERAADRIFVMIRPEDREADAVVAGRAASATRLERITCEGPGLVKSLNTALPMADGDIVAFTDDDAVPRPDWLARIEAHFVADRALGGVGGRDFFYQDGRLLDGYERHVGKIFWYGRRVGNHHLRVGPAQETQALKGVNMSFRSSALAGLRFDDRLRGSGAQVHNELDISLAVRARGWRLLYDPEVAVDHYPGTRHDEDQRTVKTMRAVADSVHNELYVLLKWTPGARKALVAAYHLLLGTREAPGPLLAIELLIRGGGVGRVARLSLAATRGRGAAVATYFRSRTARLPGEATVGAES